MKAKKLIAGTAIATLAFAMMAGCGSEKKTKDAGAASNKVTEKTTETATSDNTAVTSAENAETPKANAETPAENTETTTENSGAGTVSGEFPEGIPTQFEFGSGAGAWGTTIQVEKDGSFTGYYSDSDAGDMGDENPNGTIYYCKFSGKFTNITKVNDYAYSMTLDGVNKEEMSEYVEDGIKYVPSDPYGMESGTEYYLYLPSAPVSSLDGEFMSWYQLDAGEQLGVYGIYNKSMGYGFFG